MPTETESRYAKHMLDGIFSRPAWCVKLLEKQSLGEIKKNLRLISEGKEHRGEITGGLMFSWARVMRAVQFVMAEGDKTLGILPDPTFLRELGREEDAKLVENAISERMR